MKEYGAHKATEFTKKQINIIFAKAKNHELKVENWVMSNFYNLADYYGFDDNRSVEVSERKIKGILESVFGGDLEEAQRKIDEYTEKEWELLGRKTKENADRSLIA